MKKGALVQLVDGLTTRPPNLVVFQFNPETMQHSIAHGYGGASASASATRATKPEAPSGANPLGVSGPPVETFSFTLAMDITDTFVDPITPIGRAAAENGLYNRLAALELFMHPTPIDDLLSGGGGGSSSRTTPAALLPAGLFVWGAGRILPIRMTSLSITEKLFDADLNPTHAEAQVQLTVLTGEDLTSLSGLTGKLATAAYKYTGGLRLTRAALNLGASVEDVVSAVMSKIKPPL